MRHRDREKERKRDEWEGATINNSRRVNSAFDVESLLAGRATPFGPSNYKARRERWLETDVENPTTSKSEGPPFIIRSHVDDDLLLHHNVNYFFIIDLTSLSIRADH